MIISDGFRLSMHPLICTPFHQRLKRNDLLAATMAAARRSYRPGPSLIVRVPHLWWSSLDRKLQCQVWAPWELEKLEIWGCQWMPPTVHPTDILWAIWWYIKGVYDLPNWILAILWVYMTYPTDIWNFQLAKLLKITAGYIPQIHLRTGIAWKFATSKKMRVQSVPPGCSFDDVFLHHFHVSNFFDSYGSYVLSISLLRVVLSIIQMRELPKMTWSSQTWCGECLVDVQYTQKIAHQNISWKFHIIPSFKDPWIHVFHLHLKILYFIHDSENTMIPVTHQWLSNIPRYPKWSLRHPYSEHQPPKSLASWFPLQVRGVRVGLAPSFLLLLASISLGFLRKIGDDYDDFLHLSPSPPDLVCIWYEWSPFLILSLSVWAWRLAGNFFGSHLYPPGLIEPNPPLHPERKTGETMGAPQSSPETRPTSPDSLKVEERRRTILAKAA